MARELTLSLLLGLGLGAVALACGARLRRLTRLPLSPGLRLPADFLLGSWTIATVVVVLGLARLLTVWSIAAAVLGCAAFGRWGRAGRRWGPAAAAAAGGAVLLPVALAPPFFYDALVYHLALPWQALLEGRFSPHPEDLFSTFPPLFQGLAAVPLAAGLPRAAALLHLASFVAAGAAVAGLARLLGARRWLARAAAFFLPLAPSHALVPGLPAAEGWLVASVACCAALVLARRVRPGAALLAGLLAGIGCAARLQGLAWTVIWLAVVAVRFRPRLRAVTASSAAWVLGSSPWWLKNLVLLGEPVAPIGLRREGVATLWRDAGSAAWLGVAPWPLVHRFTVSLGPLLPFLAPLALAALLAWWQGRRRATVWLGPLVVAGVAAWQLTGDLPRFLAPTIALLVALAAAAGTPLARAGSAVALAVAAMLGMTWNLSELGRLGGLGLLREKGGQAAGRLVVNDPLPAFVACRELPASARVLFVGEPRGYGFPRRFVAPSQHDVSPLLGPLGGSRSLRDVQTWLWRRGFTHLLVNRLELARLAPSYPVAPWRNPAGFRRWEEFLHLLGPPVVAAGGVEVFSLAPRQSARYFDGGLTSMVPVTQASSTRATR
jgi:hypothetical protein